MRASGVGGTLKLGYQTAATIAEWAIRVDGSAFKLTARIEKANAAWIDSRPLDLTVRLGPVSWYWREVSPTIDDGNVSLTLMRRPDIVGT